MKKGIGKVFSGDHRGQAAAERQDYAMTQREVAEVLGITRSGVSFLENSGMVKLKKALLEMADREVWLDRLGHGNRQYACKLNEERGSHVNCHKR